MGNWTAVVNARAKLIFDSKVAPSEAYGGTRAAVVEGCAGGAPREQPSATAPRAVASAARYRTVEREVCTMPGASRPERPAGSGEAVEIGDLPVHRH